MNKPEGKKPLFATTYYKFIALLVQRFLQLGIRSIKLFTRVINAVTQ
jgi:hypothetical protein